jgi:HD-like signal output (HDOD) protein
MKPSFTNLKNKNQLFNEQISVVQKMNDMLRNTTEIPGDQLYFYKLSQMTNDVNTFSSSLINNLSKNDEVSQAILNKAKIGKKSASKLITSQQLQQAITRIGYMMVHNEVERSIAKQYAKLIKNHQNKNFTNLLKSNIRLAFVAREVARLVGYHDLTSAFFSGLTSNIGLVIIALRNERAFNEIEAMNEQGLDLKGAELAILGFEHGELGARMLKKWGLPEHLQDLLLNSFLPNEVEPANVQLAYIMKLAQYISFSLGQKDSKPSYMWTKASQYFDRLHYSSTKDQWDEDIKLLFIRLLEFEGSVFS